MSKKNRGGLVGVLYKTKAGYGFVKCDGMENDVFISKFDLKGAMSGDRVQVDLLPAIYWRGESPEGIVSRIIERKLKSIVGRIVRYNGKNVVIPEGKEFNDYIFIGKKSMGGSRIGDTVEVEITKYPIGKSLSEGRVIQIVAKKSDPKRRMKSLIASKGIYNDFNEDVMREAEFVSKEHIEAEILASGRRDLRDCTIITIDGEHSKDLDDAISLYKNETGNYILGVHIADVSHYVRDCSLLDSEALRRGTSIYLVDTVIPMLPKVLSNGVCSLNEGEDKLTLSCEMEIDENGNVVCYDIFESVINSKGRLYYNSVSDVIEGRVDEDMWKEEEYRKLKPLKKLLIEMNSLAEILGKKRRAEGSIDFEAPESEIETDEKGRVICVKAAERRSGHRLIEEFMLMANQTVAQCYFWKELPFIYRNHEKPDVDKLKDFRGLLMSLGIKLAGKADGIHPKAIGDVIEKVKNTDKEVVISNIAIRTMQKAFYGTSSLGHFGLAFRYYTHFTSPIRRYPDLFIHRIIKEDLSGRLNSKSLTYFEERAEVAADTSSARERTAIELERDYDKLKKAEYMRNFIGDSYSGIISGMNDRGVFLQLSNTVEGFLRFQNMKDDYYFYNEGEYCIEGESSGKRFSYGDEFEVILESVDLENGQIDFRMK